MKSLSMIIAFVVALCVGHAFADTVNKLCPVSGKAGDPAKSVAYSKKISFCCDKCKAKFDKDPNSFGKEIAAYKADSKKCIFSDKDVDATKTSEFKADVTVCCDRCKGKMESDPDKYIEKALKK